VLGFGFATMAIGLTWLSLEMAPDTAIWRLLLPFGMIGVGSAFVWSPLTATATRNLPPQLAGAGSAAYNSIRQFGAVLGSAGMAAFMTWRIGAEMPSRPPAAEDATPVQLPDFLRDPISAAMAQSVLLPAFVALFGIVAALFLVGFARSAFAAGDPCDVGDVIGDDDDYVECILVREPDAGPPPAVAPRPAPADPVESWQSSLDDAFPHGEPIGFAHNRSHVDGGTRLRRMASPRPFGSDGRVAPPSRHLDGSARHRFGEGDAPRGRRYRPDPDDESPSYGRHSSGE
jgi:hypothetical protein